MPHVFLFFDEIELNVIYFFCNLMYLKPLSTIFINIIYNKKRIGICCSYTFVLRNSHLYYW